jgi:hypothetical protein
LWLASVHLTNDDVYNDPGSFLVCDFGLNKWSDNNPGIIFLFADIVRRMTDSGSTPPLPNGFAHSFISPTGQGISMH